MVKNIFSISTLSLLSIIFSSCKKDNEEVKLQFTFPENFPTVITPVDNELSAKRVALGRKLFYDPILSGDKSQSCSTCHNQQFAFSDNGRQFSIGIDGLKGNRNASAIVNPAWLPSSFWDGRTKSLEDQAREPVINPIEMHTTWEEVVARLEANNEYVKDFKNAFGSSAITEDQVVYAISQFERTMISNNSKYDRYLEGEYVFTPEENAGFQLFFSEIGDCFHCHGTILFTDNLFHNNGLDLVSTDLGLGGITNRNIDNGLFRTPTLRNIEYSPPYMHDGRFSTLEEVVAFYSNEIQNHINIDPLIRNPRTGGLHLTKEEQLQLVAFLKTLSDERFITNPDLASPFR